MTPRAPVAPLIRFLDDVALVQWSGESLAVACDSCAGIGDKPHDRVRATPHTVGRFTCRVPLLEVIALGAQPFLVVSALGVEPEPSGAEILRGIREEARVAGVPGENVLISTEKNFPVSQTALGVTVLARLPGPLRYGLSRAGDLVVGVGLPKVGAEVSLDDVEIADVTALRLALSFPALRDVVPVGSGGITREAHKMAGRSGLRFVSCHAPVDVAKPAGPATCFLGALPPDRWEDFLRHMAPSGRPCYRVGTLSAPAFPTSPPSPTAPGDGSSTPEAT